MSALASEPNFDLVRIKSKYGLRCSTEEEPSEAEMSIAYQPLSNSLEDESKADSGRKTQKMKDILLVKDKYTIFGKLSKLAMFYPNSNIKYVIRGHL